MIRPHVRAASLLAAAIACHGALGTARATTPLGPELQVNTFTPGQQYHSRMSMSPTGEFVVTWTSSYVDGGAFGIAARRFDSLGAPVGAQFVVNTYTYGDQQFSAVSMNEAGEFVVVWRSSHVDGDSTAIVARRFDENGTPQGEQFVVNTYTTGEQRAPDVAVGPQGGFFVVWESEGQDGSSSGIFARRHDGSGAPQAIEFQVSVYTSFFQTTPRIVIVQPSDLVVLWNNAGASLSGRRLGQNGAVGAEFQIKSGGSVPALASTGDGGFLAVWQSPDASLSGIQARRFGLDGSPVGAELQVNDYATGSQFDAEVAGNGTDFVVVWSSLNQDGDQGGVFARRLGAAGLVGAEFQLHQYTGGIQLEPSVGMSSNGAFVVTWDSKQNPISGSYDVIARRNTVLDLVTLDVDGDGSTLPLTDGRLVIAFLFGLEGSALADLAADNCSRCAAVDISAYLEDLGLVLDIDDDGETRPLTDGMLVLRTLSGFAGSALIAGAVGDDCQRCDETEIEPYMDALTTPQ